MRITFEQLLVLPVGSRVSVSDGTDEPNISDSIRWNAWRSHNYTGELTSKTDTSVTLKLPVEMKTVGSCSFEVSNEYTLTAGGVETYYADVVPIQVRRENMWEQLKLFRAELLSRSIDTSKGPVTPSSTVIGLLSTSMDIYWVFDDNTAQTLTSEQAFSVAKELSDFSNDVFEKCQRLRGVVSEASEVELIKTVENFWYDN